MAAQEKIRRTFTDIKKKQSNHDYMRKHRGSKGVLKAQCNFLNETKIPLHWTTNTSKIFSVAKWMPTKKNVLVDVDPKTYSAVDRLIQKTWVKDVGSGKDARGLIHSNIRVKRIQRVENPSVYKDYRHGLIHACEEGIKIGFPSITSIRGEREVWTANLRIPELEAIRLPEVNEYFLFHGTKAETVENIVVQGADARLGGNGLFGQGLYLAESSTKADQYAGECCKCI